MAGIFLFFGFTVALAQDKPETARGGLVPPSEIILYVHSDLKSTDFVQPLVCALQRVLVAPVSTRSLDLPIGADLLATATQFDAVKLGDLFIKRTAADGTQPAFKYLLLPHDLKADPWRYVFSLNFGNEKTPYHFGVMSTFRLDTGDPTRWHHSGFELTAQRTYKLILKSIARIAGLRSPDACILAFPRSLEELDRKSSEFCPSDHDVLVAAGILKEKESQQGNDCLDIASGTPAKLRTLLAQMID